MVPVWSVAPQSVIVARRPGAMHRRGTPVEIWGWAWSDEDLARVDVSTDGGSTWSVAELDRREDRSWQRFRRNGGRTSPALAPYARAVSRTGTVQAGEWTTKCNPPRGAYGRVAHSHRDAHTGAGETRQHLIAKIRQLQEIIDERKRNAAHARLADGRKLFCDPIGRADERIATDRIRGKVAALCFIFLERNALRRDVPVRQHPVDGAPIRILDHGVAVVILRFLLRGTANHLAHRVDPISGRAVGQRP